MKTRIIQTRFYKDSEVCQLTIFAQHLFVYLLTCEHINISGIFELPDQFIQLESKLTPKQLLDAKQELSTIKRVYFYNSWVYVVNAEKNNKYRNSPSNEVAYNKELERIPEDVKKRFDSSVDSSVDSTVHSNHNSELINNKPKTIKQKTEKEEFVILKKFNVVLDKNFASVKGWSGNYRYWREDFSQEKILQAIERIPRHNWLKDKDVTPTMFFRTDKDWIEQCLNVKKGRYNSSGEIMSAKKIMTTHQVSVEKRIHEGMVKQKR